MLMHTLPKHQAYQFILSTLLITLNIFIHVRDERIELSLYVPETYVLPLY